MEKKSLVEFHAGVLENYEKLLNDSSLADAGNISAEEIAFNIIVHAGMLYRYTGENKYLEHLTGKNRNKLLEDGFIYVKGLESNEILSSLIGGETDEETLFDDIDMLIGVRDELESFCSVVRFMSKEQIEQGNFGFISDLASAVAYATEFDTIASSAPALMSVAAEGFSSLKDSFAIECRREDYWWMYISDEYSVAEGEFQKNLALYFNRETSREEAYTVNDTKTDYSHEEKPAPIKLFDTERIATICESALIPLAAGSMDEAYSGVTFWDYKREANSILENVDENGNSDGVSARVTGRIARVENDQCSAEWKIEGVDFSETEKTTFYLFAKDRKKIVGV
ncbi:MAG: hypothetical protein DRO01_02095, partial [Thermoproteota archaeon]